MRAGKGWGVGMNNWMQADISSYSSQGSLCPPSNPTLSFLAALLSYLLILLPPSSILTSIAPQGLSLLHSIDKTDLSRPEQSTKAMVTRVPQKQRTQWRERSSRRRGTVHSLPVEASNPRTDTGPREAYRLEVDVLLVGNTNYRRNEYECGSGGEWGMAEGLSQVQKRSGVWKQSIK